VIFIVFQLLKRFKTEISDVYARVIDHGMIAMLSGKTFAGMTGHAIGF